MWLIVRCVGGFYGDFGGELVLRDVVEAEGLARELNVVRDVRLLADQFVGLDDEAVHVPGCNLHEDEADHRGHGRRDEAADMRGRRNRFIAGDAGSNDQGGADDQQSAENQVSVGIGDAAEDV